MSQTDWGVHFQDLTVVGTLFPQDKEHHVNILEMKVVQLAPNTFPDMVMGEAMVLMSNNAGGGSLEETRGKCISDHMQTGLGDHCLVRTVCGHCLRKIHSGKKNILTDQLSHLDQVLRTEGSLLSWVVDGICWKFGPLVNLVANLRQGQTQSSQFIYDMLCTNCTPWLGRKTPSNIHGTF